MDGLDCLIVWANLLQSHEYLAVQGLIVSLSLEG